jgi:hypothetical protein
VLASGGFSVRGLVGTRKDHANSPIFVRPDPWISGWIDTGFHVSVSVIRILCALGANVNPLTSLYGIHPPRPIPPSACFPLYAPCSDLIEALIYARVEHERGPCEWSND